jgi:hypothetical protein
MFRNQSGDKVDCFTAGPWQGLLMPAGWVNMSRKFVYLDGVLQPRLVPGTEKIGISFVLISDWAL